MGQVYVSNTGDSLPRHYQMAPPPIILYALQLVLPNSSQFIINIIVTAIIKWATLKMSCTGPTSLWPYLFFFHQPPVLSSEEKHV